jgi:hypothetical protein
MLVRVKLKMKKFKLFIFKKLKKITAKNASKIPGFSLKNLSVAAHSGSDKGEGPENVSLQGDVDDPVFPSSSGIIQLNPKFLLGSTPLRKLKS